MAYFFRKALLPRRWETLRKKVTFVLAHSLSSTSWCLSRPGHAWKYPNFNYITLYTPLFGGLFLLYSGVLNSTVKHFNTHARGALKNQVHMYCRTRQRQLELCKAKRSMDMSTVSQQA